MTGPFRLRALGLVRAASLAWTLRLPAVCAAVAPEPADRRPTFTADIASILFDHCAQCHRPGGIAPMPLMTYEEVRPRAKAIRASVLSREMPPWQADRRHGKFRNDISLSDDEIRLISEWVGAGAPEGDPAVMPTPPQWPDGWRLGPPDVIIDLEEVRVPAGGEDLFHEEDGTLNMSAETWIQAFEVLPGDPAVVHHLQIHTTGDPAGLAPAGQLVASWAGGMPPLRYPEGMGVRLPPMTGIHTNVHYHPDDTPRTDRTRIGLHLGRGEMLKDVSGHMIMDFLFEVPPGEPDYEVRGVFTFRQDCHITSLMPHMHARGKDALFRAVRPDGRTEILLSVPNYAYDWQWRYELSEPYAAPAGTRIEFVAHLDNSAANPDNPDPERTVTFGIGAEDEMVIGALGFYSDEGVRPRPGTEAERIADYIEGRRSPDLYAVTIRAGGGAIPTALLLPREGTAAWIRAEGTFALPMYLPDVRWEGNTFEFTVNDGTLQAIGQVTEGGEIHGRLVSPDSRGETVAGTFDGRRTSSP